jgi:hypothetical protein
MNELPKLSPRQISCLRYVSTHRVTLQTAAKFHQITLLSLYMRDMIDLATDRFSLTTSGKEALKLYTSGIWWRKNNNGLAPTLKERLSSRKKRRTRYGVAH